MGLSEQTLNRCVATTEEEFVRKAVALASDTALRRVVRSEILASNHRLFGNITVVMEWEVMLQYVAAAPRPVPGAYKYDKDIRRRALELYGSAYTTDERSRGSGERSDEVEKEVEEEVTEQQRQELFDRITGDIERQWVREELAAAVFTYIDAPIRLRDVMQHGDRTRRDMDDEDAGTARESSATTKTQTVAVAPTEILPTSGNASTSTSDSTSDSTSASASAPFVLFSGSFVDVDRAGTVHTVTVTITDDQDQGQRQDWRKRCAEEALSAGVTDKLKILHLCTQVGEY
jgi:hypothetical protein